MAGIMVSRLLGNNEICTARIEQSWHLVKCWKKHIESEFSELVLPGVENVPKPCESMFSIRSGTGAILRVCFARDIFVK